MPLRRRGTGFLVVSAALLVVADLALGAVHHGTIQQADDTGLVGVNRQNGMQEQAGMLAVAAIAEPVLAGRVVGEVQLGGAHDRQHVPAGGTPVGQAGGCCQHLARRYRGVGQETAKLDRLIAVLGQSVQAKRSLALHRRQQRTTDTGQSPVTEPAEFRLDHANPPFPRTDWHIDSENQWLGKSFRICVTTVGA
jgi:hypothetical protein